MKPWTRTFWVLVDLGWLHHEVAEDKPHKRKWKASWCFEDISGWHRIVRSIVVTWLVLGANFEGHFFFWFPSLQKKGMWTSWWFWCCACLVWSGTFFVAGSYQREWFGGDSGSRSKFQGSGSKNAHLFRYVLPGQANMSPENQWLVQMYFLVKQYFLLKQSLFLGGHSFIFGGVQYPSLRSWNDSGVMKWTMDHHPFTIDVCGFFWQELCRLPANAVVVEALSTLFLVVVLFCLVLQSANLGYFFFQPNKNMFFGRSNQRKKNI